MLAFHYSLWAFGGEKKRKEMQDEKILALCLTYMEKEKNMNHFKMPSASMA